MQEYTRLTVAKVKRWFGPVLGVITVLAYAGCTTPQGKGVTHFDPVPREELGVAELEPVEQKVVSDILRAAEDELCKANEAHENGDHEAAMNHYGRMLQLILEADLDPALYYASREQFDAILSSYLRHAHLYHHPERRIGASQSGVYSDLVIPFPLPQPVLDEIEELQNSYPNTFKRGLNRSARYLPHLQEEFRNAGLPEDLAWLAMVESMFQAKIDSPAGAGGMWQFMRGTGRRYNLRMDSYVDERYNWHSATRAAVEYLKNLHDFFQGDWSLAVTGYNMGEYGLERAINANGGDRDLWTLINTPPASDRIKQESKKFYPRLLAFIIVANAPEQYGFAQEPEPFEDVLRIPVEGSYHLSELDAALGLPRGSLAKLNPDLLRETTPAQGEYAVAVPRDKRDEFIASLQSVRSVRLAGTHRVRRGETVSQIAQRYGVCEKELMRVNHIRSARFLQANQVLQMPDGARASGGAPGAAPDEGGRQSEAQSVVQARRSVPTASQGVRAYTVKRGDTLSEIARAHNMTISELQKINKLDNRGLIRVGQKLNISEKPTAPVGPVQHHQVKPGEYPGVIAQLYGISVNELMRWNNLSARSVIHAGDQLVVAREAAPHQSTIETAAPPAETTSAPTTIRHTVSRGETAGAIATRYRVSTRDLLAWNRLTAKSILRVGQELVVKQPAAMAQRDRSEDVRLAQAASNSTKIVHKVTAGQNPTTIARRYGVRVSDLFKWNNWTDRHILRVGDEVSIFRD